MPDGNKKFLEHNFSLDYYSYFYRRQRSNILKQECEQDKHKHVAWLCQFDDI